MFGWGHEGQITAALCAEGPLQPHDSVHPTPGRGQVRVEDVGGWRMSSSGKWGGVQVEGTGALHGRHCLPCRLSTPTLD